VDEADVIARGRPSGLPPTRLPRVPNRAIPGAGGQALVPTRAPLCVVDPAATDDGAGPGRALGGDSLTVKTVSCAAG
jgi:hypothetical protein